MAESPRKSMSKKTRFEVFKRDSFTCQYCGKAAPEVVLRVDHIHPVSKGGEDDIMNLLTACFDCNAGKSDRLLGDAAVITRQRAQLEELNERREQLEMMLQWREGLREIDDQALEAFHAAWKSVAVGWHWNEIGLNKARKLLRKHGLQNCLRAVDAAHNYIEMTAEGTATKESADLASSKLGGILAMQDRPEAERKMYYIKGILRNRLSYVNHAKAIALMRDITAMGGNIEYIERYAKECRNWSDWESEMEAYLSDLEKGEG